VCPKDLPTPEGGGSLDVRPPLGKEPRLAPLDYPLQPRPVGRMATSATMGGLVPCRRLHTRGRRSGKSEDRDNSKMHAQDKDTMPWPQRKYDGSHVLRVHAGRSRDSIHPTKHMHELATAFLIEKC